MWATHNERGRRAAVDRMIDQAARAGDYRAPWRRSPAIWKHFLDETEVLRALQRLWSIELGVAMNTAMNGREADLGIDVTVAFDEVYARNFGLYQTLEANADHPAISADRVKERAILESAGLRPPQRAVA